MSDNDFLQRFIIEEGGARGELVRLKESYQSMDTHVKYPTELKLLLGEAMCAATLLTATLKFEGKLSIQLQGEGAVSLLLIQSTHKRKMRAMARWSGDLAGKNFRELIGKAKLVITIEPDEGKRYQGIVPLEGETLSQCIEHYFLQSEQLPTQIWLSANEEVCAGFFLQKLPGHEGETKPEDWEHVSILAKSITDQEMLEEAFETILYRLFHAETVRVFDKAPVLFECNCSKDRFENGLTTLGADELKTIINEGQGLDLKCEFCGAGYRIEIEDLNRIVNGMHDG